MTEFFVIEIAGYHLAISHGTVIVFGAFLFVSLMILNAGKPRKKGEKK